MFDLPFSLSSNGDGFLAPFKVINITTDKGESWRPCKGQVDNFGNQIEDGIYNNSDNDYNSVLFIATQKLNPIFYTLR